MIRMKWSMIFTLIFYLLSYCPVFAEDTVLETRYHLDTGVYFTWGSQDVEESWSEGMYDTVVINSLQNPIMLAVDREPETLKIINVTPYNGSNFDFDNPYIYTWNATPYATDEISYRENYLPSVLTNFQSDGLFQYNDLTGGLTFGYSGVLKSTRRKANEIIRGYPIKPWEELVGDFNVKTNIIDKGGLEDIERWMGSIPDETRIPMQAMLDNPENDALQGFLYFAPMVIEYQIIDPTPLISPMVLLDCKAGSMFIGLQTPVRGSILNRNEKPVITYYTLTVNGSKVLQSGCILQDGGKSKKVDSSYTIPGNTKPGTQFVFKLEARQTWAYDAPNRYLPEEEGKPREVNPEYEPFINSHTYVSAVNAWYENDGPWVTGEAICRKTAVLLPEAPLNHEMNPSVIVE